MNPARGILMKLGSVVLFVAMAALIKATAGAVPPGQQVFFRSAFAVPVILIWLVRRGDLSVGLRVRDPMGHVWRGLIGTAAMGFAFAALGLLPLPEVTAIGYAAPLLVVIFAAMFLGEDVRLFRLSAVALGLVGVLIVLSPRLTLIGDGLSATQTLGAVFALTGAILAALAQIFIRKLVQGERTSAIVFWFSVTGALLSLTTLPFGWAVPDLRVAGLLIVAGLLGGLAQIMLTSAYRYADASLVAPFEYASMLFALGIGYAVFDELPAPTMLAGAAIIMAAGVLIIWRERRLGIERARQRKATPPQS
ncbi:MAG: DMT family transporter [Paracoccus sp. (in: a-proteobacteria)]|uniref:DMT family transporter n=1 Tax=Paracoccus sp. TaxID=267 RepID=UPI0026E0D86D|nr:DMT family transporter [Paracoccus sp. (in: a-proteobacteria)]MDO5614055.1 DMT family transporter [Paracoccus sp. (in: a-proteobacteria)]